MSFLLWNCQGLGPDLTVRALRGLINKHWPTAVFLMETKSRSSSIEYLRRSMGYNNGYDVPPEGLAGGLSRWWDDYVVVSILFSSKYIIYSCLRSCATGDFYFLSWVYGTPYHLDKESCWDHIC